MNIQQRQVLIEKLKKTDFWFNSIKKYINDNLDLHELASRLSFEIDRRHHGKNFEANAVNRQKKVYYQNNKGQHIIISPKRSSPNAFIWSPSGQQSWWNDSQKAAAIGLVIFSDQRFSQSEDGKREALEFIVDNFLVNDRGLQDKIDEILKGYLQYNKTPGLQIRKHVGTKSQSENKSTDEAPVVDINAIVDEQPKKIFPFAPSHESHPIFLNRGITEETLNHPLFKSAYGFSNHKRLGEGDSESGYFYPKHLVYESHLVIPFYSKNGDVIAIEQKNRLKEDSYLNEYQSYLNGNNKPKRNPSKFIEGSDKTNSLSRGNLPEEPTSIIIAEQVLDYMSFWQLNREKLNLENAITYGTGGTLTANQALIIKDVIRNNKSIQKAYLCFDNDINGLSYALYATDTIKAKDINPKFEAVSCRYVIDKDRNLINYEVSIAGANHKFDETIIAKQQEIIKLATEKYPIDNVDIIPSLVNNGGKILTLGVQYSEKNAAALFKLHIELIGQSKDFFSLNLPHGSKDWNDMLNGVNSFQSQESALLIDAKHHRNRIYFDQNGYLKFQPRVSSFSVVANETIGSYTPFSGKKSSFDVPNLEILSQNVLGDHDKYRLGVLNDLNKLTSMYKEQVLGVNYLDNSIIRKEISRAIIFNAITSDYSRGKDVLARVVNDKLEFNDGLNSLDKLAIQCMELNRISGFKPDYTELYFHASPNGYNLMQKVSSNNGLEVSVVDGKKVITQTLDHGYFVKKNDAYEFIAAPNFQLNEEQRARRDQFVSEFLEKKDLESDRFYLDGRNRLKEMLNIGTYDPDTKLIETTEDADLENELLEQGLERIQQAIRNGQNPNTPGLIAKVGGDFTLVLADGIIPDRDLSPVHYMQLQLLDRYFNEKRIAFNKIKQQFPEPFYSIQSNNGILIYNGLPLYKFDTKTNSLLLLTDPSKITNRAFNPNFYKTLKLFVKNKGTFFNYMNKVKVRKESAQMFRIFYSQPDFEVGFIFVDKASKKPHYSLYKDCPVSLRDTIRVFAPYLEADLDILKNNNLDKESSTTKAKVKEKKVSDIPLEFLPFFDPRTKKFVPVSDEILAGYKPHQYMAYTEANMWNLLHKSGESNTHIAKHFIHRRGKDLFYGDFQVASYNEAEDRLEFFAQASREHYAAIALEEREIVKNEKHRKYSAYLEVTSGSPLLTEEPAIDMEKVRELAQRMAINNKTGDVLINNKDFKAMKIARINEDNNSLDIDSRYKGYGAALNQTFQIFAKERNLKLTWVDIHILAEDKNQVLDTPSIHKGKVYNHELILSNNVILSNLVNLDMFKDSVRLTESNGIEFLMYPTVHGQKILPFGSDYSVHREKLLWTAQNLSIPGDPKTLIISDTPEQGLLAWQGSSNLKSSGEILGILNSMNKHIQLLSMPNSNIEEIKSVVSSYIKPEMEVLLVGDKVSALSKDLNTMLSTRTIDYEKSEKDIIEKLNQQISQYKPDPELQSIFGVIDGHNFLNPSKGLGIFPVTTEFAKGLALVGEKTNSKLPDNLWFSKNPKSRDIKAILLCPTIEEAIHYMAYNKKYLSNTSVIAFNGEVTEAQINHLHKLFNNPKFENKIFVVNTDRLFEKLQSKSFRLSSVERLYNAEPDISFQEKMEKDQRLRQEYESVNSGFTLHNERNGNQGNNVSSQQNQQAQKKRFNP